MNLKILLVVLAVLASSCGYDGRIGIGTQYPFLVTDANFFQDFYLAIGAVYDSSDKGTVLPPPAPGEGDLVVRIRG